MNATNNTDVESNPLWYRVANLKIQMRDHVSIHRHHYRGKLWYVIRDAISNRHYRFTSNAYQLIRRFDGKSSVEAIWQRIKKLPAGEPPSQEDIINLLTHLHVNELIVSDASPDTTELFYRYEKASGPAWKKYIKGPLLIRLPMFDPNGFLNRFDKVTALLFNRIGYVLWALTITLAVVLCVSYWADIRGYWHTRALAPYNLVILVLTYPIVKAIHEFAHGLAVKRWGGEVHEMGVMFLLFMPLPYIDASSSTVFKDKYHRIIVSAAGIMTEVFLAAIASLVWFSVETGIIRDIAYDVMLIGGISTVLFNANPLLRFDGYYVLIDAIEIPNLAQRSTRFYGYLLQKYLFRVKQAKSPETGLSERSWLLSYGISSTTYRLFILITIALFLFEEYLVFGLILGAIAVFLQVVLPISKQIQFLFTSPLLRHHRVRAVSTSLVLFGLLILGLFFVPLPTSTYTQGLVWLPEDAQVRTPVDGFIEKVLYKPQTEVTTGTPLIETSNSLLTIEVERIEWELKELKARLDQQIVQDRVETGILIGEIDRVTADLEQAKEELSKLTLLSPTNGTFLLSKAHHINGRFVHKGDVLGYVTDLSQPTIRAVVRQSDISLVREKTNAIKIRLADNPGKTLNARILRQIPLATARLPDQSLGTLGGGLITVDPKDSSGTTTMEDIFLVDITMPEDFVVERMGTRVHIRFEHEEQTLAKRIYRGVRQLFLKRFTV